VGLYFSLQEVQSPAGGRTSAKRPSERVWLTPAGGANQETSGARGSSLAQEDGEGLGQASQFGVWGASCPQAVARVEAGAEAAWGWRG
jgi:hypothetical protein